MVKTVDCLEKDKPLHLRRYNLTKIRGFWKVKRSISFAWNKEYYNVNRNISELCKRDLLYDIKYYVYNLPHEFPNESKLRILAN